MGYIFWKFKEFWKFNISFEKKYECKEGYIFFQIIQSKFERKIYSGVDVTVLIFSRLCFWGANHNRLRLKMVGRKWMSTLYPLKYSAKFPLL